MVRRHRFNKFWAIGITAVGFAAIVLGVVGDSAEWFQGVWTDLFIEFGAGIALVAIIVYVELRLISQETAAVEQLLDQRQAELIQQIEDLEADVERLSEQMNRTRQEP